MPDSSRLGHRAFGRSTFALEDAAVDSAGYMHGVECIDESGHGTTLSTV